MRTSDSRAVRGAQPARILIIDDHEVSRAAYRALLRTEGLDVVADVAADDRALALARALRPDVALIDVTPAGDTGFGIARRLLALAGPPVVLLTSSADRAGFGARLDAHQFIAKADLCAAAIVRLAAARGPREQGPANPVVPATCPEPRA